MQQLHQRAVLKSNELNCDNGQGLSALDLSPLVAYGGRFEDATAMRPMDGHPTVVAIGIFPGNTDELDVIFPLLDEAQALLGSKVIRLLLDRGFSRGDRLYHLKATYGIDWIISPRDAARVVTDVPNYLL